MSQQSTMKVENHCSTGPWPLLCLLNGPADVHEMRLNEATSAVTLASRVDEIIFLSATPFKNFIS